VETFFQSILHACIPNVVPIRFGPKITNILGTYRRLALYCHSAQNPRIGANRQRKLVPTLMNLDPGKNQGHVLAGDVAKDFQATPLFKFLGLEP